MPVPARPRRAAAVAALLSVTTGLSSLLVAAAPPGAADAAPPVNDDVANPLALEGLSGQVAEIGLDGATAEPTDPALAPSLDGATVWFEWTAPVSDTYRFTVESTDAVPVLGVLLGDAPDQLEVLRATEVGDGPDAVLEFPAVGGHSYHVLVDAARRGPASLAWSRGFPTADSTTTLQASPPSDGTATLTATSALLSDDPDETRGPDGTVAFYRGAELLGTVAAGPEGTATWSLTEQRPGQADYTAEYYPTADRVRPSAGRTTITFPAVPAPANDAFADARVLTGASNATGVAGTTVGATADPGTPASGLPAPAADSTVWYRWTAPSSGSFAFTTTSPGDGDTLLRAFSGTTLSALRRLAENDDLDDDARRSRVGINARAGQTYHLLVDGYDADATGPFTLTWATATPTRTTTTPVLTSSVSGRTVTLTATVPAPSSGSRPPGVVEVLEGSASRGVVPVGSGGVARLVLSGVAPGEHRYQAVFVPDDSDVAQTTSAVRTQAVAYPTLTELHTPGRARTGSRPQIDVMVTRGDFFSAGKVRISVNRRVVATRTLDVGIAILTLPRLPVGRVRIDAAFLGSRLDAPSSATRYITVGR